MPQPRQLKPTGQRLFGAWVLAVVLAANVARGSPDPPGVVFEEVKPLVFRQVEQPECLPIPEEIADIYELERPVRLKHPAREPTQLWQVMEREHVLSMGPEERGALLRELLEQLSKLRLMSVSQQDVDPSQAGRFMRDFKLEAVARAGLLDEDLVDEQLPRRRRCVTSAEQLQRFLALQHLLQAKALKDALDGLTKRGEELKRKQAELTSRKEALEARLAQLRASESRGAASRQANHHQQQQKRPSFLDSVAQSLIDYVFQE